MGYILVDTTLESGITNTHIIQSAACLFTVNAKTMTQIDATHSGITTNDLECPPQVEIACLSALGTTQTLM